MLSFVAVIFLLVCVEPLACLLVFFFVAFVGWAFNKFTTAEFQNGGMKGKNMKEKKISVLTGRIRRDK